MSVRQIPTDSTDREWNRFQANDGDNAVVIEQFDDDDPEVWIHSGDSCERYSVAELVEMAGLDD